ncbi:MAG: HEAT repeat domain-containing protein [Phycisphaerales bacterium]|nr:HEAT repeat domain-containing protein [Phycisphaerales bacterium]
MDTPPSDKLKRIYDLVAASDNLAADSAFIAAMPRLTPALQALALDKIGKRAEPAGLAALVASFGKADARVRAQILERIGDLYEGAKACMTSEDVEVRLSAVDLIQTSCETGLAYLLTNALTLRCPRTTPAAATAILCLTRTVLNRRAQAVGVAQRRAAGQDARRVADALEWALNSWPAHFRGEVLVASMWLCDLTERTLFDTASGTRTNMAHGLREALRQHAGAVMAPFALRALQHSSLRSAAIHDFAEIADPAFAERVFDEMWLTLDPAVAHACHWIRQLGFLRDGCPAVRDLTGRRARDAVRLIALSGIGAADEKLNVFRYLMNNGSPDVAEAALWEITQLDTANARDLLQRVARRECSAWSRIATLELFRRDPLHWREKIPESPVVTPSADEQEAASDFQSYWDRFEGMSAEDRLRLGRRLYSLSPGFDSKLRAKLNGGAVEDRLHAMLIVRTLGVSSDYDEVIYRLSHDPDEKVRSFCVSLLAQLEGAIALRILRRTLDDPDPRVQANAIEVLSAIEAADADDPLARKLHAEHNRVRATAIKALLPKRVRQAAVALLNMLASSSPHQRVSALWVVEHLSLATALPRVREMAASDPDPRVRERARRLLDDGWTTSATRPAAEVEVPA